METKTVTKKSKNGNRLPLFKTPLSIPETLKNTDLFKILQDSGKLRPGDLIDPMDASIVLHDLHDDFQSRRLKDLWVKECEDRLKRCVTDKTKGLMSVVLESVRDAEIGSGGWWTNGGIQCEIFKPSDLRLAQVIKLSEKKATCEHIQKEPNLDNTL